MLHVLPCGNEGSFEHRLCRLRNDGINAEMENRFFYEDTGHVRRLTTERLSATAAASGFELAREFYSNQHEGAINWITQNSPSFVMMLTEPAKAKDAEARKELSKLRKKLIPISALRYLHGRVKNFNPKKRTAKACSDCWLRFPFIRSATSLTGA